MKQQLIQRIWKALDAYALENIVKGRQYNCTTTISTTLFCVCNSTRTIAVTDHWNGFEIVPSYDNNQIKQQIIGDLIKLQTTLFHVLASYNVYCIPLYKGVNT